MNFLRYPLTSQKFFLNTKKPHIKKFGAFDLFVTTQILNPLQGSTRPNNPTQIMCTLTDALGLDHLKGKIPLDHLYIERR